MRKPEKGTLPKVFYIGADDSVAPAGDRRAAVHLQGRPGAAAAAGIAVAGSVAAPGAARVDYDTPHEKPWGLDMALYLLTKGIATGAMLLTAILWWLGDRSALTRLAGRRSRSCSSPPRRRSSSSISSGPSASTTSSCGRTGDRGWCGAPTSSPRTARSRRCGSAPRCVRVDERAARAGLAGRVVSLLTTCYTGFLFAQGLARDLWQGPHSTIDLLAQAVAEGARRAAPRVARAGGRRRLRAARWRWTLGRRDARAPRAPPRSRTCSTPSPTRHHELAVGAIRRGAVRDAVLGRRDRRRRPRLPIVASRSRCSSCSGRWCCRGRASWRSAGSFAWEYIWVEAGQMRAA